MKYIKIIITFFVIFSFYVNSHALTYEQAMDKSITVMPLGNTTAAQFDNRRYINMGG